MQHLFRYRTGQFVNANRDHRFVWAAQNNALLEESAGKGHAVHRVVMRRQGHRVVGRQVLTRSELREMLRDENAVRGMIN